MDDEWDLHAIVRSCNKISTDATAGSGTNMSITIDDYGNDFDVINPFSYSTGENPSEELKDVYKEGCSQPLTVTTTTTTEPASLGDEQLHEMLNIATDSISTHTPSRKRKTQQKKMVVELTQDELCTDIWAWRRYGQKPIKGSPFRRSYYKCDTTKACGARRQVERSHTDPTIFIMSYYGEHIHPPPPPIHTNPLDGSTRSTNIAIPNIPIISDDTSQS